MMSSVDGEWRIRESDLILHPFASSGPVFGVLRLFAIRHSLFPANHLIVSAKNISRQGSAVLGRKPGEVPCSAGSGAGLRPGGAGGAGASCRSGRPRGGAAGEVAELVHV